MKELLGDTRRVTKSSAAQKYVDSIKFIPLLLSVIVC